MFTLQLLFSLKIYVQEFVNNILGRFSLGVVELVLKIVFLVFMEVVLQLRNFVIFLHPPPTVESRNKLQGFEMTRTTRNGPIATAAVLPEEEKSKVKNSWSKSPSLLALAYFMTCFSCSPSGARYPS